jgi:hypothetical protein
MIVITINININISAQGHRTSSGGSYWGDSCTLCRAAFPLTAS